MWLLVLTVGVCLASFYIVSFYLAYLFVPYTKTKRMFQWLMQVGWLDGVPTIDRQTQKKKYQKRKWISHNAVLGVWTVFLLSMIAMIAIASAVENGLLT